MSIRKALRRELRRRALILRGRLGTWTGRDTSSPELQVYQRMRDDLLSAPALYHPGAFWDALNRSHADMIRGGGLTNLRDEYINRTFAGPDPESRQVYRAFLYLYLKQLRGEDDANFLAQHEDTRIGGSVDQELIDSRLVSFDFLQSVDEALKIRRAWTAAGHTGDPELIVELGAGFGRLAYVCRLMFPACTYVILDLPEALICSASWLSRVFPDAVAPYHASRTIGRLSRATLRTRRLWFFTPDRIERIDDGAVDVFCNIYSFAEMPKRSIENYFRQLARITNGVFYTKQRMREVNRGDNVVVARADYPIPADWHLLFEQTSPLYEDFFEAAYSSPQA